MLLASCSRFRFHLMAFRVHSVHCTHHKTNDFKAPKRWQCLVGLGQQHECDLYEHTTAAAVNTLPAIAGRTRDVSSSVHVSCFEDGNKKKKLQRDKIVTFMACHLTLILGSLSDRSLVFAIFLGALQQELFLVSIGQHHKKRPSAKTKLGLFN